MLATSHDSVFLLNRGTDWTVVWNFTPDIKLSNLQGGKLGYYGEMTTTGDAVIIGVPSDASQGVDTGAVIVFEKKDGKWPQVGRILRGQEENDQFGYSVAISVFGSNFLRILVGAPGRGYAKIYTHNSKVPGPWYSRGEMDELGDFSPETGFGYSVDISSSGTVAVVGSPFYDGNIGKGRAYDLKDFEFAQQLTGSATDANAGYSVAISGDGLTSAVGLPLIGEVGVFHYSTLLKHVGKVSI